MNGLWKPNQGGSTLHGKTQGGTSGTSHWADWSWGWQWGQNICALMKKGTGPPHHHTRESSVGPGQHQGQPRDLWPPHQPQPWGRSKAKPGSQDSRSRSARHEAGNKQAKDEGLSWNASSEWRQGGPREVPHRFLPPSSFPAGCPEAMRLHHARASHEHCKPSPGAGGGCTPSFDQHTAWEAQATRVGEIFFPSQSGYVIVLAIFLKRNAETRCTRTF